MQVIKAKSTGDGPDSTFYINVDSIQAIYEYSIKTYSAEPNSYIYGHSRIFYSDSFYDDLISQLNKTKLFKSKFITIEGYSSTDSSYVNGKRKPFRVLIRKTEINYIEALGQLEAGTYWDDNEMRYLCWIHLYPTVGETDDKTIYLYLSGEMLESLLNS